jgi:hypothetical protein
MMAGRPSIPYSERGSWPNRRCSGGRSTDQREIVKLIPYDDHAVCAWWRSPEVGSPSNGRPTAAVRVGDSP